VKKKLNFELNFTHYEPITAFQIETMNWSQNTLLLKLLLEQANEETISNCEIINILPYPFWHLFSQIVISLKEPHICLTQLHHLFDFIFFTRSPLTGS